MQVTVYADEAFLLNGAVDYLLLICAAKLGGGRIARLRLLAAALFGGLYADATLFAPLGVLPGLPMKLISHSARAVKPSARDCCFSQQVVRLLVLRF